MSKSKVVWGYEVTLGRRDPVWGPRAERSRLDTQGNFIIVMNTLDFQTLGRRISTLAAALA